MASTPASKASKGATLHRGDTVTWDSSQGTIEGTVVKKVTGKAQIKGHAVSASEKSPQYEVKSAKTGAHAVHKPEALKKKTTSSKG
ncbi:MAG: DUF2945 domain-containing protein [Pseudomonadota bacterium]